MTEYMKRFGFYSKPPLDYPTGEMITSKPVAPTAGRTRRDAERGHRPDRDRQGGLLVTPLQMAMVAAAVANGGTLMTPHLDRRVVDQDGRTVKTIKPSVYTR